MCEDVAAFVDEMQRHGVPTTPPVNQGWGTLTEVVLPGGGKLGVYEPHHARPQVAGSRTTAKKKPQKKKVKTPARKPVKRVTKTTKKTKKR
jgi:hypothetical protein